MLYRPRAPKELSEAYRDTADLARQRVAISEEAESRIWLKLADYCEDMANYRALDDDQTRRMKRKWLDRRAIPMTNEQMDELGLFVIGQDTKSRRLPKWKEAALELALGYLSPWQRVCYEMVTGGRLTTKEVAKATEQTEQDVRKAISNARKKLRSINSRISEILGDGQD